MCGGGKGGGSTTTSSSNSTATQSPPSYLDSAYQALVQQAQGITSQPLQQYPASQLLAPFSNLQNEGLSAVQNEQGVQNPYINAAANSINASQTPVMQGVQSFSPQAIQGYENPYQTDVTNATMAEINQTNAQQQAQQQGNAISQGALGGDRAGIAAAALANQQGLAANQTLAQLNNQNYSQAETELNTQQQTQLGANEAQGWLNSQAGAQYGNLGTTALNADLTGSNALLNAGALQQQQTQAGLNIPYEQYTQSQAYPFQTNQYLADILEGIGGVAGGTTTGNASGTSTTNQTTSPISQILGGASLGTGILGSVLGGSSDSPDTGSPGTPFTGASALDPEGTENGGVSGSSDLFDFLGSARGGRTYKRGGLVPRRALAQGGSGGMIPGQPPGGMLSGVPDVDVSFIPLVPPSGARGDFPNLPSPPSTSSGGGGSSSSGGGGLGSLLDLGSSIGDLFNRGGGVVPRRGYAGGGSLFSSMSAARHLAPRIAPSKTPDLLKVPKFDDGGAVGEGIGGLLPTAQNQNPITQSMYSKYSSLPTEKLQELAARSGGSPQGSIIQQALHRKQMMPNAPQATPGAQQANAAPANPFQTQGGFARGGVSHGTRQHFDDGGVPDGISIPYPAPPDFVDNPDVVASAASGTSSPAVTPSGGLAPGFVASPVTHHDPLPPAEHYQSTHIDNQKSDPWQVLMAAGAGMLAGHGTTGQNIGQGVEAGLKNYNSQKAANAERDYKQGTLDDAVDRLNNEADSHRDTINMEQEKLDQASITSANDSAYKQSELGLRNRTLAQDQFQLMSDGMGGFVKMNKKTGEVVPVAGSSGGMDTPQALDADGKPLSGDAFLKTLPASQQATIKAYANGDAPWPAGYGAIKPMWMNNMLPKVLQYDPSASGQRYGNVQRFETGKQGDQIKYLNTAIAHLDTAQQLADAMDNGSVPMLNKAKNLWQTETGEEAPTDFNTAKQIVSTEVMKAISNAGAGGVGERDELQSRFRDAGSPAQLKGAVQTAQKLLVGQMGSVKNQYEDSTGRTDFIDKKLSARTRDIYNRLDPSKDNNATQTFANAPAVGTVKKGFKYTGGDPAAPGSWSKVPQ